MAKKHKTLNGMSISYAEDSTDRISFVKSKLREDLANFHNHLEFCKKNARYWR